MTLLVSKASFAMFFVGLNSWIIRDGNYGDFRVGQTAKFALEFHPYSLHAAKSKEKLIERVNACRYRVRGQVAYVDRTSWVIDFGLLHSDLRLNPKNDHFYGLTE